MDQNKIKQSPFKTLSHQVIDVGRFKIAKDKVLVGNHQQNYDYLCIRSGVCVIPIFEEHVVMIKQYRYPIQSWQWEFPGGFIDENETAEQAAIRELEEETGYLCKELIPLGSFYPSFGSTNEEIFLYAAICKKGGELALEPGEVSKSHLLKEFEVESFIQKNQLKHGAGLVAWLKYQIYQNETAKE